MDKSACFLSLDQVYYHLIFADISFVFFLDSQESNQRVRLFFMLFKCLLILNREIYPMRL